MIKKCILLVSILSSGLSYSKDIHTLRKLTGTNNHDTVRAHALVEMTEIYYSSHPDSVIPICERAIRIADAGLKTSGDKEKQSFLKSKAAALNNMGALYYSRGNIEKALELYLVSLDIRQELNDKKGMATNLNNIGAFYNNLGDIPKALEYYHNSLKLHEEISDKRGMAYSLNNIGYIHKKQGDNQNAIKYYHKSLKLREEIGDRDGMAITLNNIGAIYKSQGDYKNALHYYERSLKLSEESDYKTGMALCLNNIGTIYFNLDSINQSIERFNKSLKIWEEISDKEGMAYSLNYIAMALLKQGKAKEAQRTAERSLQLAKELGFPENIKNTGETLSRIYSETGNWKGAYEMQVLFKQMSDSINNENIRKSSIQKEVKYAYDKKAAADSIKAFEERKVFQARMAQEKTQRNALYLGLGMITVFSLFMYNRFRVTRKQKEIIEEQKTEVDKQRDLADERRKLAEEQKQIIEEKQKEILDSIHYASRIQQAMLTSESYFDEHLQAEYFIFYQPKDIVSGDFYWAIHHHNKFYVATSDCTGHGVPGAFMSLLNISFLNENVFERGLIEPSVILDEQRKEIIKALNPTGNENSKDGMDCVVCAFDIKNNVLDFAAANNPLWLIRNNQLSEYKGDKMPVGKGEESAGNFTPQRIELQKGDLIYTFTDGITDQFGGPKGKKFRHKQFNQLLIDIHHLPMAEQKQKLSSAINEWKGDLEQVDDILVIGVRV